MAAFITFDLIFRTIALEVLHLNDIPNYETKVIYTDCYFSASFLL